MKTKDFYFDLPEELIAQYPPDVRGNSNLLVLDRHNDSLTDTHIQNIGDYLEPGSLLVFNNTKVRKARICAYRKDTGGKQEFLLLEQLNTTTWKVLVKKAKKAVPGRKYLFPEKITGSITDTEESFRIIEFDTQITDAYLNKHGSIPLPPYIKRESELTDEDRYQTVFSEKTGSAAAPTAGLHFTNNLIEALRQKGIEVKFITLHVGIGTFLPIRTKKVEEHLMHREVYSVPEETAKAINSAKKDGRPVVAVGTTSVRTLESSWNGGKIESGTRETELFIYPGYKFNAVDSMITNFHTPESSLIVMVSAFAGKERIMKTYNHAIKKRYRFFSYGDAVFIK